MTVREELRYVVNCDGSDCESVSTAAGNTPSAVRNILRTEGWEFERLPGVPGLGAGLASARERDFCPDCAERRREAAAEMPYEAWVAAQGGSPDGYPEGEA